MPSTIEAELLKITKLKPARGESRAQLLTQLWDAAHNLSDRDWNRLSASAATWVNDITHQNKLWKAKKPNGEFTPGEFPDLVQAAEEPVDEPAEAPKPKPKAGPKPKPEPEPEPEPEEEDEEELPESKPEDEDGDEEVLQTRGAKTEPEPEAEDESEEDEPETEEAALPEEPEEEVQEEVPEEEPEDEPEPVQAKAKPATKPAPKPVSKPVSSKPVSRGLPPIPKSIPRPAPNKPAPKKAPQPEHERPATNVQGMVRLKIIENPGIETSVLQQEIEDAFGVKVSTETVRSSRSWFKAALRDLNHAGCLSKKFQAELMAAGALRKGS